MKRIIFSILLLFIIVSSMISYKIFFKKENNDNTDVCPTLNIECPDGFFSKCNSVYDSPTKECIECIPDCTGHETLINKTENNSSGMVLCPDISPSSSFCKDGEIISIYNDIGCAIDYECK